MSLAAVIRDRHDRALAAGALQPVATTARLIADGGMRFVVRVAVGLEEKAAARARAEAAAAAAAPPRNPFLPYEEALFVAALPPDHVLLFNKFNVIDRHLLIVTRAFEDQETLLTPADWAALWCCLDDVGGLGFYNGGQAAGASQPHKHLQLVPLPLAAEGPALPLAPLLAEALPAEGPGRIAAFAFRHALARLDPRLRGVAAAVRAAACYRALLAEIGIGGDAAPSGAPSGAPGGATDAATDGAPGGSAAGVPARQTGPYNLLVTREWMLIVARRQDALAGISVNALGFAGSLFVRNDADARRIETIGPLNLLAAVAAAH